MHTKTLQFFFSFWSLSFFHTYGWTPNSLSFQTPKRPCFTDSDLEGYGVSHPSLLSMPALSLPMISSCLPSASFSGYSSPDVYYKGSGPDEAKQNALHVTGEKRSPWGILLTVRQEDTVNNRLTLSCQLSRLPLMYSQKAPGHYAVVDTPKNPRVTLSCGVIHS